MVIWVDDIFHAGTKEFEKEVMVEVGKKFMIGRTEEEAFSYIGLNIETNEKGITLDQIDFIKKRLETLKLRGGNNSRPLDKEETQLLRHLTGKINWAATQSQPDIAYMVVELNMNFKKGCLKDMKKVNKVINRLKGNPVKIIFLKIEGDLEITMYSDGAFANLRNKISSRCGHVIFLTEKGGEKAGPLAWMSNKVKRVVESTPAAKSLSLQEAIAHGCHL